jgi:hypothetical protein
MRPQGWYRDPDGNHTDRWFSDGRPTSLVRDQGAGSDDKRRLVWLPEWRWWTVCLPGLLALAVSGSFLVYGEYASATNCRDGCSPVTEGMPVGTAGEIVVAILGIGLLVAGVITPDWRRAIATALWMAFVLGCGCAALIGTARPAASVVPAAPPPVPAHATPSLDAAACTAIGGRVVPAYATCFAVPYVGKDGQRDYGAVSYGADGQLTGPAQTVGTGATQAECDSGRYPDGPAGPVTRQPGRWDAQLSLCLPRNVSG